MNLKTYIKARWCALMHGKRYLYYTSTTPDSRKGYCQRCGIRWQHSHPNLTPASFTWFSRLLKQALPATVGHNLGQFPLEERAIATLIAGACGDALGASFETMSRSEILHGHGRVLCFVGTETRPLGYYTDDTQMTLALANSLLHCGKLNPEHCAKNYARYYKTLPKRGYGSGTAPILEALADGADYRNTGHLVYADGSSSNGGAMRISPIGIAFRNASNEELYNAVKLALLPTHTHPDAIDGAWIQAKAVAILIQADYRHFDVTKFLRGLQSAAKGDLLKAKIQLIRDYIREGKTHEEFLQAACIPRPDEKLFQRSAVEAVACSLWCFARYYHKPEECMIQAVELGGDTDTIASMAGSLVGALHGCRWIPLRWFDELENAPGSGRDFIIHTAKELCHMDLRVIDPDF